MLGQPNTNPEEEEGPVVAGSVRVYSMAKVRYFHEISLIFLEFFLYRL
jgi:hypothetical protein